MKEISLSNSEFFELSIGERVLKKEVRDSDGDIPIYSANVHEPFGYLEESNLDDFSHDYILWGIDGDFELSVKHSGGKFGTTDHCGTIKILDDRILPEYALYALEVKKHKLGFDRNFRPSLTNMRKVSIEIPTDGGEIDVESQEDLVERYRSINEIKDYLESELEELRQMVVDIGLPTDEADVSLNR